MELSFIWIKSFRNIINQGFNISSKYNIHYDNDKNILTLNNNPEFIPDFFGKEIVNVTGIIGQNAAGKTNLLELINYCLNEGNTKLNESFLLLYCSDDKKIVSGYNIKQPVCNQTIIFEKYQAKNNHFDSIYLSNTFDGRKHGFSKNTLELTTNSFFQNKFGENFFTNYKQDMLNQVSFINSSDFEILSELEHQEYPNSNKNFKPTHVVITAPTWGNIRSRAAAFDKVLSELFNEQKSVLKDFCLSYRSKITRNKSDERSIIYFTSFLLFIDYLVNEFIQPYKKNSKNGNFELQQLESDITELGLNKLESLSINEVQSFLTNDFASFIDKKATYGFDKFKFIKDLKYSDFDRLVERDSEGSYSDRKLSFKLVFTEETSIFIRNYLKATSNLTLTYNIDWQGISSGHKAYLAIFSRLYSIKSKLLRDNIFLCIDEGDLYFHPKWQTEFLNRLLTVIPKMFKNRPIQIVLSTHSPFLVSDLPKENLIFLTTNNGMCKPMPNENKQNTFGGNIGELYLDAFFLKGSLISEFAANKIKGLIERVINNSITSTDRLLLNKIGEKVLRNFISKKIDDKN